MRPTDHSGKGLPGFAPEEIGRTPRCGTTSKLPLTSKKRRSTSKVTTALRARSSNDMKGMVQVYLLALLQQLVFLIILGKHKTIFGFYTLWTLSTEHIEPPQLNPILTKIYPADSAKNFPGISIGSSVLFSVEYAGSGLPSGRTRIPSPPNGIALIPDPIRRTTRFPSPVFR